MNIIIEQYLLEWLEAMKSTYSNEIKLTEVEREIKNGIDPALHSVIDQKYLAKILTKHGWIKERRKSGRFWLRPQIGVRCPYCNNGAVKDKISRQKIGSKPLHVYFISDGEYIKIGISSDVDARVASLQSANARKLSIIAIIPGNLFLERSLHKKFKKFRKRFEWFDITPEMAMEAVELLKEQQQNNQ